MLYSAKAGGVFAVTMLLAIASVRAHHPFARFGPANAVTAFRALLAALVAALGGEPSQATLAGAAVTIASIAVVLDGVDGWLARRTQMASAFGARFDMEVDALLILALSALTWQHGKAGAWIL